LCSHSWRAAGCVRVAEEDVDVGVVGRFDQDSLDVMRKVRRGELADARLLGLGEIDHAGGFGDSLVHDLELTLRQLWLSGWGLSITVITTPETTNVLPVEVSLTRNPYHSDANMLGVRGRSLEVWGLLTGQDALSSRGPSGPSSAFSRGAGTDSSSGGGHLDHGRRRRAARTPRPQPAVMRLTAALRKS
jgi:hypothetical protein